MENRLQLIKGTIGNVYTKKTIGFFLSFFLGWGAQGIWEGVANLKFGKRKKRFKVCIKTIEYIISSNMRLSNEN